LSIKKTGVTAAATLALLLPGVITITPAHAGPPVATGAGTKAKANAAPPPASADDAKTLLANAPKAAQFPNAAKATLLDLADMTVRPDGSCQKVIRMTVKVFNIRGRDDEAEVKIPYNAAYETVTIRKARTIKPDGTIINVKPADIRESRPSEYDDAAVKSFSMPAVSDDSIIDYEYEVNQKESMMPGQFWDDWYFQGGFDPVMLTRLTITTPKDMKLNEKLRNTGVTAKKKDNPDGKTVTYVWEDKNVPPMELEPMMPDVSNSFPTLHLSTIPDWQKVADWYWSLAKDRMVADDSIKAATREVIKGKNTPEDKAKAIFQYVQEKTRYVAIELGISAYQPRPAQGVLANQYGDCKDMASLLVAMLREAGVTAHPVLLHAGSREDKTSELPSPGEFNHAICLAEIDGKKFWLDATAQVCPWGVIPSMDRGCNVLVVREGKGAFEKIPEGTPEDNRTEQTVRLTLSSDGSATGTVTMTGTGDVDMYLRSIMSYLPENKVRPYLETQMAQKIAPNARVTGVTVSDFRNRDLPVTLTMNVTFPSWAKQSDDLLIFNARPEQGNGSGSSPFREDLRLRPVEQDRSEIGISTLELTLPSGFTALSVPKTVDVKSDLGRFERTIKADGNKMTITTRGSAFRATVPSSRYEEVRTYYKDYLKAADAQVIIKKN
jgi:hypothetical protein